MSELAYPWHTSYWQHLTAYVAQQRIPQALLIEGVLAEFIFICSAGVIMITR
jgi:hypothetical protein